jgi:hypothetical protein
MTIQESGSKNIAKNYQKKDGKYMLRQRAEKLNKGQRKENSYIR